MKKKYVTFTVRAAYQPKDDTIHLTSKDLDGPWHLTLNRHSEAEETLRKELVAADLIAPTQVALPEHADYPVVNDLPWHQFPLGVTRGNQPVIWDVLQQSHALIVGPTGAGKSVINRNLLLHLAQHPEWQVVGIDLKRVELSQYRGAPALADRFFNYVELKTAVDGLRQLQATLEDRFNVMSEAEVTDYRMLNDEHGNTPRPIFVLIDEAFVLLSLEGAKTGEGKERDRLHGEALQYVTSIAALGRAAGIHLAIATQRPDSAVIPGSLRSMLEYRMATGRLNPTSSLMVTDSKLATNLPKIRGRGIVVGTAVKPVETQFYWSDWQAVQAVPAHPTLHRPEEDGFDTE